MTPNLLIGMQFSTIRAGLVTYACITACVGVLALFYFPGGDEYMLEIAMATLGGGAFLTAAGFGLGIGLCSLIAQRQSRPAMLLSASMLLGFCPFVLVPAIWFDLWNLFFISSFILLMVPLIVAVRAFIYDSVGYRARDRAAEGSVP
ncbi:MAG: hypothetical protein AAFP26_00135 [Planctomycetota bacterium]